MATYRFEAKVIGRSSGRSATASAAYRAGERIQDARTGQSFDYTRKGGVLHAEILAPAGTPDWMRDRSQLWNAVEKAEKRKDAQLARDLVLSLPHELTDGERRDLVRDFVHQEFVAKGMIADIAIHAPDRRGDDRNHHAHVMLTMRELTSGGFGNKAREWNSTDLLDQWRERWGAAVNVALERGGHAARVDHRSLADQGLDREPEPKQGPLATKMEKEGRPSNAGDDRRAAKARNEERAAIEAELEALGAEIIDLQAERLKREAESDKVAPTSAQERQDMSEEDRAQARQHPSIGTTDGSLVAQQREAQRRFEENSKAMQARQAEQQAAGERTNDLGDPQPAKAKEQDNDISSREGHRRLKSEAEPDRAEENRDEKSPNREEKLQRFREQMNRSFSRDDPGDRSR